MCHEIITSVTLGLDSVLLAGHAVSLARLLLVDGLFLLSLELCVNFGAFRGLVAMVLSLSYLCKPAVDGSEKHAFALNIREVWGPSWTARSPCRPWARRPSSPQPPGGWQWIAGPLWSWSAHLRQAMARLANETYWSHRCCES